MISHVNGTCITCSPFNEEQEICRRYMSPKADFFSEPAGLGHQLPMLHKGRHKWAWTATFSQLHLRQDFVRRVCQLVPSTQAHDQSDDIRDKTSDQIYPNLSTTLCTLCPKHPMSATQPIPCLPPDCSRGSPATFLCPQVVFVKLWWVAWSSGIERTSFQELTS